MNTGLLRQHFEKIPAFVTVAQLESLSKAAKVLSISQAALSQSMKKLEEALEVSLFIRSRKGMKLTSEGQILFEQGKKITDQVDLLETQIRKNDKNDLKRIQIGTHEALAIHFWPNIIESFQRKTPNHLVSIMSGRIDQLIQQVLDGDLDMALTVQPKTITGIQTKVLYEDEFKFYVTIKNKLKLTKKELSKMPILTDNHAHLEQGKSVIKALGEIGLFGSSYFELNSFEAAARLAEKGVGVALLPTKIANNIHSRLKLKSVNIAELPKSLFEHRICYSYRQDAKAKEQIKPVLEFLEKMRMEKSV